MEYNNNILVIFLLISAIIAMSTGFIALKSQINNLEESEKELVREIVAIKTLNVSMSNRFSQSIMVLAKEVESIKKQISALNSELNSRQTSILSDKSNPPAQIEKINNDQLRLELKNILQEARLKSNLIFEEYHSMLKEKML